MAEPENNFRTFKKKNRLSNLDNKELGIAS